MTKDRRHLLWDLPTRVFHWTVVFGVCLAWWSAENEHYDIHEWTGYALLVLLVSRIAWGFLGSVHSRFSDFLAGPKTIIAYLRDGVSPTPGHNPLGGWSVVALLTLLLLQAISGLFNSDDILFSGPLYYAAEAQVRDYMGLIHDWAFDILLALVALHIVSVCYYQFGKKQTLIQPMLFGRAQGREGASAPAATWKALVIVLLLAGLLWLGLEQAPQP